MSLIADFKERTAPLSGTELAIIEDETGLRGIRTELLRGLQGPPGASGLEEEITTDFVLIYQASK